MIVKQFRHIVFYMYNFQMLISNPTYYFMLNWKIHVNWIIYVHISIHQGVCMCCIFHSG